LLEDKINLSEVENLKKIADIKMTQDHHITKNSYTSSITNDLKRILHLSFQPWIVDISIRPHEGNWAIKSINAGIVLSLSYQKESLPSSLIKIIKINLITYCNEDGTLVI